MELETFNKLYLEMSQIATAKTGLELHYERALQSIVNHPQEANNTTEMRLRLIAKDALKSAEKGKER